MNHVLKDIEDFNSGLTQESDAEKATGDDQHTSNAEDGKRKCHVTVTFAQSLDGCICQVRGKGYAISCPETFEFTHRLRAVHDAIVVGIGTVLADNPSLTTRLVEGKDPHPVVIDSKLRIPMDVKLFTDQRCKIKPCIVCTKSGYDENLQKAKQLEELGCKIIAVQETVDGHVDISEAIKALSGVFNSLMIEGGAKIISAILSNPASVSKVNRVILTIAPIFLGGLHAIEARIPDELVRVWELEANETCGSDILMSMKMKSNELK